MLFSFIFLDLRGFPLCVCGGIVLFFSEVVACGAVPSFFMRNSTTLSLNPKEGGTTSVSSSQGSVRLFFSFDISRNRRAFRVHRRTLISIVGLQHNPRKSGFRVYKSEFRVFRYDDSSVEDQKPYLWILCKSE